MIALIQRVTDASVRVDNKTVGSIESGLLVLLCVEENDDEAKALRLSKKVLNYRIFSDQNDKMNLNVKQAGGDLLVISQFTLSANTNKGNRPSFSGGAEPSEANRLYELFNTNCRSEEIKVETGVFAADMQVSSTNDGPVTFWLQV